MKIAVLGSVDPWQTDFWRRTAKKMGHSLDWIKMQDVAIRIDKKGVKISALTFNPHGRGHRVNLKNYDCILRRWIKKFYTQSLILCSLLQKEGKVVVNSKIDRIQDKITQAFKLRLAGLPHPPTYQSLNFKTASRILNKVKYPVILKQIEGSLGGEVYLANSKTEALEIINKYQKQNVIIQKYFPVHEDFRIFVVGDQVLGAMKRIGCPGDFRNNVAQGARIEKAELTQEMKELALRAARVLEYEVAGVDIIYYRQKPYILEVNRTPQFKGFNEALNINVAEEIIKYLEKLYLGAIE